MIKWELCLKKLQVKNFRGFSGVVEFEFDPQQNEIIAENRQGKTSIAEAIIFAIAGTNLTGNVKNLDDLITQGEKQASVCLTFIGLDKKEHQLIRKMTARKKELILDGQLIGQVDLTPVIGPINQFATSFFPAGLGAMKDSEAREFFMKLVKKPTYEEVINTVDDVFIKYLKVHQDHMYDTDGLIKEINHDMKQVEEDNQQSIGQQEMLTQVLSVKIPDKVQGLEKLQKELDSIDQQLEQLSAIKPQKVDTNSLEEKIKTIDGEIDKLLVSKPKLVDTAELEEKLIDLRVEIKRIAHEGKSIQYDFKIGDICPTCGQKISASHLKRVSKEQSEQKQKLAEEYKKTVQEGKKASAELAQVKSQNEQEETNFQKKIANKMVELRAARQKIEKQIADLNEKALQEYTNKVVIKQRALNAQRAGIYTDWTKLNSQNLMRINVIEQKQNAKEKLAEQKKRIAKNEKAIAYFKNDITAIKTYIKAQTTIIVEQLQEHLKHTTIQLFEIAKTTGEIKPTFKMLYDNKHYRLLSLSERVCMELELANMIKQLIEIDYPSFVDNKESISKFEKPSGQLFISCVKENQPFTLNGQQIIPLKPVQEVKQPLAQVANQ